MTFGLARRAVGMRHGAHVGIRPAKMVDPSRLHAYQRQAVGWLASRRRALLADDLGLGKSASSLCALPKGARSIVVCPAALMSSWVDEAAKFRADIRTGRGRLRRPGRGQLLLSSYDSLPDPAPGTELVCLEDLSDVFLILDECQCAKAAEARRTLRTRRLVRQCRSAWGLTATPMMGTPNDLWGVLETLELTADLGWTWEQFARDGFGGEKSYAGHAWGEVSPEVSERLARVMLRRLRADVLSLPPLTETDLPVDVDDDLRPFLDKVTRAWDAQDASAVPGFALFAEARLALARAKTPAAVAWLDENASRDFRVLAFSAHVDPVHAMGQLRGVAWFTGESSDREVDSAISRFRRGDARALAMTIKTGGVGLNLQEAAAALFVDREVTPAMNDQALGRGYRQGQQHDRFVSVRLVSTHPLDRRLAEILDVKEKRIRAAVRATGALV